MKDACVLGIDLGTSSVKVVVVARDGSLRAVASQAYGLNHPQPGWAEQDPHAWWEATAGAVREAIDRADIDPNRLRAVGLSGQTHGTVLLDGTGGVIRPAITWMDQRSAGHIAELARRTDMADLTNLAGMPASCGFMAFTLLWLREHCPDEWAQIQTICLPKDYLRFRLTGRLATDVTDAWGTFLLDTRTRTWSKMILQHLDLESIPLPPLRGTVEVAGGVTEAAAARLGICAGTPVAVGGADQVMGAVGNGLVDEGTALSMIGTGGQLLIPTRQCRTRPDVGVHTMPHVMPDVWLYMGAVLTAGMAFDWWCRKVLESDPGERDRRLTASGRRYGTGAEDLPLFLPYLDGERTPHMDPYCRGAFVGMRLHHDADDLTCSVMEGVTLAMRDALEVCRSAGATVRDVIASGGGARSAFWRQLQADVYELPVRVLNVREQSAYGAAVIAAVTAGFYPDVPSACGDWIRPVATIMPTSDGVRRARTRYRLFRQLYPHLQDDFRQLAQQEPCPKPTTGCEA